MTAAMLLMLLSLPWQEVSPLATPETVHDWAELPEDEDGSGWYDRSFNDVIVFEGAELPVVLVRFSLKDGEEATTGDMLVAVDCAENRMGAVAAWNNRTDEQINFFEQPDGIVFDFAEPPFDEASTILFRQACGQDWQP